MMAWAYQDDEEIQQLERDEERLQALMPPVSEPVWRAKVQRQLAAVLKHLKRYREAA